MISKKTRKYLHSLKNVNTIWEGYKTVDGVQTDVLCIVCGVEKKLPGYMLAKSEMVPVAIIENNREIPTDVVEIGIPKALEQTERMRPAPCGISIGHVDITAGTLGCLVTDMDEILILSNNHVLANINKGLPGDAIVQPGVYDGGKDPEDKIGELYIWEPILFGDAPSTCKTSKFITKVLDWFAKLFGRDVRFNAISTQEVENIVDCAIAYPDEREYVTPEILGIGRITGKTEGVLGMSVKKSGRTTGYTEGKIEGINASSKVSYGDAGTALFVDQLIIKSTNEKEFSAGGDSGSLIVSADNKAVGLLFAGGTGITIANRIQNVCKILGVEPI